MTKHAALAAAATAFLLTGAAPAPAQSLDALIEGAKEEGMLTTIVLPHEWCG